MTDSPESPELSAALAASRRRESWLSAASDIITLMLLAEDPREVLNLVAERAREVSAADNCSLVLHHEDGTWHTDVSIGFLADDVRGAQVGEDARSVRAAVTGKTALIHDPMSSPGPITPRLRQFGSLVYVPLAPRDDRPIGTLVLANKAGGRRFDAEDVRLAAAFASQAGLALALTEARAAHDRLAVYADRERIARDLHDLTIQRIFAAGMALQALRRRLGAPASAPRPGSGPESDVGPSAVSGAGSGAASGVEPPAPKSAHAANVSEEIAERLDGVIDELDAAISEIRTTIFGLQLPPEQEASSLRARILREASKAALALGFDPSVRFAGPLDSAVGERVAGHLIAALRESLANAAKHADARNVAVRVSVLTTDDGVREVALEVNDDGHIPLPSGWMTRAGTTSHPAGKSGNGLANLAARAAELSGTFEAGPAKNGTRLVWRVPL